MLLQSCSALVTAACHASSCFCQQLPGTFRLLQIVNNSSNLHLQIRNVAQPARQMDAIAAEPAAAGSAASGDSTLHAAVLKHAQQHPHMHGQDCRVEAQEQDKQQQLLQHGAAAQPPQPQQQQLQGQQQIVQQQLQQQQQPSVVSPAVQPYYVPPTGVKKTFYKRKLPCPPATEFSSADGRLLFAEALQHGTMTGFFKLIEQYSTQDEPAFCGLASIAMVLNALSIDPKRPWKGSWRWFHEQLLDCCLPLSKVAKEGVVLTQAACLAKCNGANVTLHRSGTFSLEEFRQAVIDTCTSGEEHLVVSYTRKAFGQTGDGHFSPVGGYHADRDLVLILDTARFKYPPHWVPLPMLYDAMGAIDPATGQPRGYLRLSANARPDSVLFTLDIRPDGSWQAAEGFIQTTAPALVQAAAAAGEASPEALLHQLVALAPLESVLSFIAMRFAAHSCARDRCVPHTVRQQVLQELRATPLHQAIQPLLAQLLAQQQQQQQQQDLSLLSERLTVLLLLQEPSAWGAAASWADPQQHKAWQQLLDASAVSILEGEVGYLRQQLLHIEDMLQVSAQATTSSCNNCNSSGQLAADAHPAAATPLPTTSSAHGSSSYATTVEQQRAAAAGQAQGLASALPDMSDSVIRDPCSSCIFQHDCSLRGCLNRHGEVEVPGQAAAPMARQPDAAAAAAAAVVISEGAAIVSPQQKQQQHNASVSSNSRSGCCGTEHSNDEQLNDHGCCSL